MAKIFVHFLLVGEFFLRERCNLISYLPLSLSVKKKYSNNLSDQKNGVYKEKE